MENLLICDSIIEEVFQKSAKIIVDKLYDKMRKPFVRMQLLQQVRESSLFGKNCADQKECVFEDDEAEEPKTVTPDRFQQNYIPYTVKDPPMIQIKSPTSFERRQSTTNRLSIIRRQSKLILPGNSLSAKSKRDSQISTSPFGKIIGNNRQQTDFVLEANVWEKDKKNI